jgi:hypothetical protein
MVTPPRFARVSHHEKAEQVLQVAPVQQYLLVVWEQPIAMAEMAQLYLPAAREQRVLRAEQV